MERSSSNTVYDNFFNNTNNVKSSASVNKWNITKTAGTNIVGGPYIGGNVWAYPSGTGYTGKITPTTTVTVSPNVPGFEIIPMILGVGIAIFLIKRKK